MVMVVEIYFMIIAMVLDVISVCGMQLNAEGKIRSSFWVWLVANIAWVIYDLATGEYVQAVLFIIYAVQCIFGLWRKEIHQTLKTNNSSNL